MFYFLDFNDQTCLSKNNNEIVCDFKLL